MVRPVQPALPESSSHRYGTCPASRISILSQADGKSHNIYGSAPDGEAARTVGCSQVNAKREERRWISSGTPSPPIMVAPLRGTRIDAGRQPSTYFRDKRAGNTGSVTKLDVVRCLITHRVMTLPERRKCCALVPSHPWIPTYGGRTGSDVKRIPRSSAGSGEAGTIVHLRRAERDGGSDPKDMDLGLLTVKSPPQPRLAGAASETS